MPEKEQEKIKLMLLYWVIPIWQFIFYYYNKFYIIEEFYSKISKHLIKISDILKKATLQYFI